MKTYHETYIRKSEIAQLILLHRLYAQKESRHLIFQGGTALRWCYGGSRFSEDLDFVTPLASEDVQKILNAAVKGVEKLMIPHFGIGMVMLKEKSAREDALKYFMDFRPVGSREKISIKLEFEGLAPGKRPDIQNHVLSLLSPVAYLIAAGEFRVPRPNTIVVAQTPTEIFSDKVRALLERQYLKGRDFFDLWYLYSVLKMPVDVKIVERKFTLYRAPFVAARTVDFFVRPSKQEEDMMRESIEQDLSRFLPPDVLAVHQAQKYAPFLEVARALFSEIEAKGVHLP
ncbi:MAG: nucleotidyl transferase AbiEii/AbiGii toxin family protein [Deltaproteobacteria bacterium]|nr:nucleotidyl transferase AbiEii/AbiGii toxin family protein [Deltaproteobacteria bacterium]